MRECVCCVDKNNHSYRQTLPENKIQIANLLFNKTLTHGPLCNSCFSQFQNYQQKTNRKTKKELNECKNRKLEEGKWIKMNKKRKLEEKWTEMKFKKFLQEKIQIWSRSYSFFFTITDTLVINLCINFIGR